MDTNKNTASPSDDIVRWRRAFEYATVRPLCTFDLLEFSEMWLSGEISKINPDLKLDESSLEKMKSFVKTGAMQPGLDTTVRDLLGVRYGHLDTLSCSFCQLERPVCDFTRDKSRKRGYHRYCKFCLKKKRQLASKTDANRIRKIRQKNKEYAIKQLGGKCARCGYDEFVEALDFHHINPRKKSKNVSSLLGKIDTSALYQEIRKCILLCGNCHSGLHSGRWSLSHDGKIISYSTTEAIET